MSLATLAREQTERSIVAAPSKGVANDPKPRDGAPGQAEKPDPFKQLTRYLPAETITLFVAAMGARASVKHPDYWWLDPWMIYGVFALLTPVFLLALTYIKLREADPSLPFRPHPWPPVAALIAFLIWALSIQGLVAPDVVKEWGGLIAFGALSVSTLLSLIDRVVGLKAA